jgi:serine/threonine-protein kinase
LSTGSSRKFHFLREIASGGFGSVFLAKVIHGDGFSRLAAIKLLHPKWSENEEIASRMRDEARLLGWLRHKNIVDVMDLTRIQGRVAVLMEYLEAVDVKVIINELIERGEHVPVRVSLQICAAVASALDAAYNRPPYAGERPLRVIHRDIKPSNVMVDSSGTVKVLDFGVARADFDQRESHTQELAFGSLEYMPPERLFFEPESHASDVYSLGVTLFEILALEKFGKAKLRPKDHVRYIEERLDNMLASHPMPSDEVAEEVCTLITEMLSFDEEGRPSAADCVSRMRKLARTTGEIGIEEWSEHVVPPVFEVFQKEAKEGPPDPLVGQVLGEDTKGLMVDDSEVREVPGAPPKDDEDVFDPATDTAADDERWHRLKQATLADIAELDDDAPFPPPPPMDINASMPPGQFYRPGQNTQQTAPPDLPPDPYTEETQARGSGVMIGAMLGGALLLLIGVGAVGAVAITVLSGGASAALDTPPVAAVDTPKAPVDEPKVIEGPAARFVSGMADTKKMTAKCDGGSGKGETAADVAGEKLGKCIVTAIDSKRKRVTVVVDDVVAKTYVCFDGGAKECK